MDTLSAFAMGAAHRNNRVKTFDWVKAANIIKERKPKTARAGLGEDWSYTGGNIWENGQPDTDSYTYLSSTWATPELEFDDDLIDCWCWEDETGWNSGTKWPKEALEIINNN